MPKVSDFIKHHGKPVREVYLDHENSGWVPPEVVKAMLPYFNKKGYGHPSITNLPGWEAYEVVESTLEEVSKTINAKDGELILTHSGTEANNLAIIGGALAKGKERNKIITSAIEHVSVLFPARSLEEHGYRVVTVPVDKEGFVDPDMLSMLIDHETLMVSIQMVNHEIGTIQDIKALVETVKDKNDRIIFHTDVVDAYGRMKINVEELGIDLLTLRKHACISRLQKSCRISFHQL